MKIDVVYKNGHWVWYVLSTTKMADSYGRICACLAHGTAKDKATAETRAYVKMAELLEDDPMYDMVAAKEAEELGVFMDRELCQTGV